MGSCGCNSTTTRSDPRQGSLTQNQVAGAQGRLRSLLLPEPAELLLEAREAAAAVEQMLLAAGPRRMRFRVDIEAQRVAGLAPGGTGGELGSVSHDDLDGV